MFSNFVQFVREIYNSEDFISLHAPIFSGKEREYVMDTINSTFVSSVGEYVTKFEKGTEIYNVQNSLFFFIYFNFSWIFSWISWIFLISWNGQIFFWISWNCPISFWISCTFYQTLYIICPLPKDKAKQLKVCLM